MRSFSFNFATAAGLLLFSLLLFSAATTMAMPVAQSGTIPVPDEVLWQYFGTTEVASIIVADGNTTITTQVVANDPVVKPAEAGVDGQPVWTCETSAASPSAEDIVMVANHLSFAKYGLDPDVNCFPERKYVKGEYPNEEIDQSKITGPVCWRISGPSDADTAVIGVCGLPRITKCRRIEFAAKMIALKCMNKQELAGGTYKMIDDDLTVLVYHASMG